MKKLLSLFIAIIMLLSAVACSLPACPHLDGDGDGKCDLCSSDMTGGAQPCEVHTPTSELVCSVCGCAVAYYLDGRDFYMGEYPQTIKDASVTVSETVDSRGYYLGSDGFYYAKVTTDPTFSDFQYYSFSNGEKVTAGADYYFKVEPIRWRTQSMGDGAFLVLSDKILDNGTYDYARKTYSESDIRDWLNDVFIGAAFNGEQMKFIGSSELSVADGLIDGAFLLTKDRLGYFFPLDNKDRRKAPTDYAKAKGIFYNFFAESTDYGYAAWWLRDSWDRDTNQKYVIAYTGEYNYLMGWGVAGIVPAMYVNIPTDSATE